jgi:outer membrane protein assembly factor BamB
MNISDLVFIGIKGSVVALDRSTGEQVWATNLTGSDFVNVVLENGRIFAMARGEVFCLDPLTGNGLWHNRLKGFGIGLATVATEGMSPNNSTPLMTEKRRRDQQSASAGAGA